MPADEIRVLEEAILLPELGGVPDRLAHAGQVAGRLPKQIDHTIAADDEVLELGERHAADLLELESSRLFFFYGGLDQAVRDVRRSIALHGLEDGHLAVDDDDSVSDGEEDRLVGVHDEPHDAEEEELVDDLAEAAVHRLGQGVELGQQILTDPRPTHAADVAGDGHLLQERLDEKPSPQLCPDLAVSAASAAVGDDAHGAQIAPCSVGAVLAVLGNGPMISTNDATLRQVVTLVCSHLYPFGLSKWFRIVKVRDGKTK